MLKLYCKSFLCLSSIKRKSFTNCGGHEHDVGKMQASVCCHVYCCILLLLMNTPVVQQMHRLCTSTQIKLGANREIFHRPPQMQKTTTMHMQTAHLSSRINGDKKRVLSSSWLLCRLLCRLLCWLLCWLLWSEEKSVSVKRWEIFGPKPWMQKEKQGNNLL